MSLLVKLDSQGAIVTYPYYRSILLAENPETSFPANIPDERLADYFVYPVQVSQPPDGGLTHSAVEIHPALVEGVWVQQWELVPLDQEVVEFNLAQAEEQRQASLWEAAHAYEKSYISGVGLSILAVGVLMQKPKAQAVSAWSSLLWNGTYYPRKQSGSTDFDFSVVGPIPHSVPELSQELTG